MTSVSRFLEWYLGLPPTGEGEGRAWSLSAGTEAGAPLSVGGLCLLGGLLLGLIGWLYSRTPATAPLRRRVLLAVLRSLACVAILAMLSRVSLQVERTEFPTLALLVDVSGSMGLEDQYSDPRRAAAAKALARLAGENEATRLAVARGLLAGRQFRWLKELQQSHQVRLFTFDEHLHAGNTGPDVEPEISELQSTGGQTAPGRALRELLESFRGLPLSAVLLLTDGVTVTNEADRLSAAAPLARERGVPLYTVGIGSEQPAKDLELYDLLAEEVVYLGDPLTLSFRRRSFGLSGKPAEVRVTAAGSEEPLVTRGIELGADGASELEEVTITPDREGPLELVVEVPELPGEVDASNNRLQVRVVVRRDRFRVLLVEGAPRWEHRCLKPVLERDDTIQLDTFLQEADLNYAPEDRTALANFPSTDEQLGRYDAIVWGDVDLETLDPQAAARLDRFVRNGGGLLLIAGERHNPAGYRGTDLETLLPVLLAESESPPLAEELATGFRLQRTDAARGWSFLKLADGVEQDETAWRSLPDNLAWLAGSGERKAGAQVLATAALTNSSPGASLPAVVHQRYGQGQVLYHATDELWKWRKRVEDLYYGRYWLQAVRTVARTRGVETTMPQLTTDRRVYQPGDDVRLRLRVPMRSDAGGASAPVQVSVQSSTGSRQVVSLSPRSDEGNVSEGVVRGLPLGDYRAALLSSAGGDGAHCAFRVDQPQLELRQRSIDRLDLELAAKISRGRFVMFNEAERLPREIPPAAAVQRGAARFIPLWNRWELLLTAATLLALEWLLRRRARLV